MGVLRKAPVTATEWWHVSGRRPAITTVPASETAASSTAHGPSHVPLSGEKGTPPGP